MLRVAAVLSLAIFVAVYGVAVGHGFLKDDFGWIVMSRVRSASDLVRVLHASNGFYRPMIALSFTADDLLFGANAKLYGLTNLVLALGCASAVMALARSARSPWPEAIAAGLIFQSNFFCMTMAMLWISGRTVLLMTLFGTLSAAAASRRSLVLGLASFAAAMFCREDAMLLCPIVAVWLALVAKAPARRIVLWAAGSASIVALYLFVRSTTPSMLPWTAPSYYKFSGAVDLVSRNAVEYLVRSSAVALIVALIGTAALWSRATSPLARGSRRVLAAAAVWIGLGLVLALLLPVRSDLYACLPSVGAAVGAAVWLGHLWRGASERRRRAAAVVACALPLAIGVAQQTRTRRWVEPAEFSTAALGELTNLTAHRADDSTTVLFVAKPDLAFLEKAFGDSQPNSYPGLSNALWVVSGRRIAFRVDTGAEPPLVAGDSCVRFAGRHFEPAGR